MDKCHKEVGSEWGRASFASQNRKEGEKNGGKIGNNFLKKGKKLAG